MRNMNASSLDQLESPRYGASSMWDTMPDASGQLGHRRQLSQFSLGAPATPGRSPLHSNPPRKQQKIALVVDGRTLAFCLQPECEDRFTQIASKCTSVLCCRSTPLQKASVVKLAKEKLNGKTLAIGDGANDVSMIQCADVGIGISGQEGMQAVMASDFALARFKFLKRLLLVHGHWCYDRLARTVLYFFHKNSVRDRTASPDEFCSCSSTRPFGSSSTAASAAR